MHTNEITIDLVKAYDHLYRRELTAEDRALILRHAGVDDEVPGAAVTTPPPTRVGRYPVEWTAFETLTARERERLKQDLEDIPQTKDMAYVAAYIGTLAATVPDEGAPYWLLDVVAQGLNAVDKKNQWRNRRLDELERRVTEIEQRPVLSYEGTWQQTTSYTKGMFVTHAGSLWHCESASIGMRPGASPSTWRLAVKRGNDGKDVGGTS